jgi:hypothetical protein
MAKATTTSAEAYGAARTADATVGDDARRTATEDAGTVTDGLTQQLFGTAVEPDKPAPTVEYDALGRGAIVTHKGLRIIEFKKDGEDRKTKLHMFATRGGGGPWFSMFGTANLDSQLRKTRPGAVLLLRYAGKQPVEGSEQGQHVWEVRETAATAEQIAQLRARPEWVDRELLLDGAILAAATAEKTRRQNRAASSGGGGDAPPPHDDEDRPF